MNKFKIQAGYYYSPKHPQWPLYVINFDDDRVEYRYADPDTLAIIQHESSFVSKSRMLFICDNIRTWGYTPVGNISSIESL